MIPKIVILTGPTASGKTSLALQLAQDFALEIVNADSLQVYRYLNIGTAKPTPEEQKQVPHHLIDVLDPDEEANAYWYSGVALEKIQDIVARGKTPLVVGGSPFYLQALERPPQEESQVPRITIENLEEAHSELAQKDPEAAKKIHPNDRYRLERALALLAKDMQPSQEWKKAAHQPPVVQAHWLALDIPRPKLYDRIHLRMEQMFDNGLIEEAQSVLERFPASKPRLQKTIGYKEVLSFLEGDLPKEAALEKAQQATRNYAKRQMTWFRAESRVQWLESLTALDRAREIMEEVKEA